MVTSSYFIFQSIVYVWLPHVTFDKIFCLTKYLVEFHVTRGQIESGTTRPIRGPLVQGVTLHDLDVVFY